MPSALSAMSEAGFARATLWVLAGNQRGRRFCEAAARYADGTTMQDDLTGSIFEEVRYWLTLT